MITMRNSSIISCSTNSHYGLNHTSDKNKVVRLAFFNVQVMVVTTHEGVPEEFHGAHLIGSRRSVLEFLSDDEGC